MRYLPIFFLLSSLTVFAQKSLTEQEAIEAALKNSAALRASGLVIRQNNELLKSAKNIKNPDVIMEGPTGLFYTIGVTQTMDYPTVYKKQSLLQKQQIILSEKERGVTENDIKFRVKSQYLILQYSESLVKLFGVEDSLYAQISQSSSRQFEAGQIDYLAKTFAESQFGEVRNKLNQSQADVLTNVKQLQQLMGITDNITATTLQKEATFSAVNLDDNALAENPTISVFKQSEIINKNLIELEKAKALPGLIVGYFNQGLRDTPAYLRFRIGVSVPLWQGQYKSRIRAAQTGFEIAQERTNAQKQTISVDLQQALGDNQKYRQTLDYYETKGLKQSEEIITTASRLFKAGQNDYVSFLRTLNDAYTIRQRYIEALRNYNQTQLNINYLLGNQ
jgi:cobalt-zinc-cadmium efflux system outer membrane protein